MLIKKLNLSVTKKSLNNRDRLSRKIGINAGDVKTIRVYARPHFTTLHSACLPLAGMTAAHSY